MYGRVGWIEGDEEAAVGGADLAGELGEGTQQVAHVVWVGVVADEAIEEPVLGVVGADLDAIDDGFVLEAHDFAAGAGVGDADARWEGSAGSDETVGLFFERSELTHRASLGDLEAVGAAAVVLRLVQERVAKVGSQGGGLFA